MGVSMVFLVTYALWSDVLGQEEPLWFTLGYKSVHRQDRAARSKHAALAGSK